MFRFIELHANSELMGGLTERDWIPKAPGLRRKMAVLAKTQDEIGHAHLLYMVAADLGVKSRAEMLEDLFAGRGRFHNVFHYQAVTWADQVAIAYLVDAGALISQQAVFKNCSYGPYRRILRRIIAEEGFHMRHGEEMLLVFAEGTPVQREMFQAALDRWWWPTLHMFGPPSKPDDALLRWHIKSERNEDLRDRFVQKYATLLAGYGFTPPDPDLRRDPDTGRWITGEIDWAPAAGDARQPRPRQRPADRRRRPPLGGHRLGARRAGGRRRMIRRSVLHDRPDRADPEGQNGVWRALQDVDDPEYPGVSIVDLGLVEDVRVDGRRVEVDLVPTYSGCPALSMIAVRRPGGSRCAGRRRRRRGALRGRAGVDAGAHHPDGAGVDGVVLRRRRRRARPAGDVPPLRCRGARRAVGVRSGALPVDPAVPVVR